MAKKPRTSAAPVAAAARDWPVAGLALAAFAISVYLAATKLAGGTPLFCDAGSGCDIVQASRWATFVGIPTAAWGAVVYAGIAALALTGLPPKRWLWTFALAAGAVTVSAYLTAIELFVLRAICPWCVVIALLAVAILVALLVRRPAPAGKRSPTRPARVATVGAGAAVVTLVLVAGIWAFDPGGPSSSYATSLARHLGTSGGVMYGAFW